MFWIVWFGVYECKRHVRFTFRLNSVVRVVSVLVVKRYCVLFPHLQIFFDAIKCTYSIIEQHKTKSERERERSKRIKYYKITVSANFHTPIQFGCVSFKWEIIKRNVLNNDNLNARTLFRRVSKIIILFFSHILSDYEAQIYMH